jgi:UDP-GlcNAc:undecaprenyl-phosphate/decaprenyl-phosphate GlcNAc-1-phosphate transferase
MASGWQTDTMKSYITADPSAAGIELRSPAGLAPGAPGRQRDVNSYVYFLACVITILLLTLPARTFFVDSGQRWLYTATTSFGLTFILTPLVGILARRLRILDLPDARKAHAQATPLLGGLAVFVGFAAPLLFEAVPSSEVITLLGAAMILLVTGGLDDWMEVPAVLKLLIQLICTTLVMISGIVLRVLPLDWGLWGTIGNFILTGIWIIGITNAMNFFDGIDGLATGLGAIIAFFLSVVAFQTNQSFLGWIALSLLGSCLGFLPYNFRPTKPAAIFLGDSGSTVIGFVLASLAVFGDWAEKQPIVSIVSPILIFWLLIFDMGHITCERILTGKIHNVRDWLEYVGNDHLHHRIAEVLGSRRRATLFIYLLSVCLGLSALVLRYCTTMDACLLMLQAVILVALITALEHRGRSIAVLGRGDVDAKNRKKPNHPNSKL